LTLVAKTKPRGWGHLQTDGRPDEQAQCGHNGSIARILRIAYVIALPLCLAEVLVPLSRPRATCGRKSCVTDAPMQGDAKTRKFVPHDAVASSCTLSLLTVSVTGGSRLSRAVPVWHEWFRSTTSGALPIWPTSRTNSVFFTGLVHLATMIPATLLPRLEICTSLCGTAAVSIIQISCSQIARFEPLAIRTRQACQGC
jgi:hypothetical protein